MTQPRHRTHVKKTIKITIDLPVEFMVEMNPNGSDPEVRAAEYDEDDVTDQVFIALGRDQDLQEQVYEEARINILSYGE